MLYCRFCGSELPDDARFCGGCGSAVSVAAEGVTHLGSSPERGMPAPDAPTFISSPSQPVLMNRQQDESGRTFRQNPSGEGGVHYSQQSAKPHTEESQAILLDLPFVAEVAREAQAPFGNVPVVHGTPQAGGVPVVQGTPPLPHTPPGSGLSQGAASSAPSPLHTPLPPQHGSLPARPAQPAQSPIHQSPPAPQSPQPLHHHIPSYQKPRNALRTLRLQRPPVQWLIVLVAGAVIVIAGGLGVAYALIPPPTSLSLVGSSTIVPGGTLHLHGQGFTPGRTVTLTLDNHIPLAYQGRSESRYSAGAAMALSMLLAGQLQQPAVPQGTVMADSRGAFDVTLAVSPGLHLGSHTIRATEETSSQSAELTFTIVQGATSPPAPSPTPTPTSLPTPTSTPTPGPTPTPSPTPSPTPTPGPTPTPSPTPVPSTVAVNPTSINANTDCSYKGGWACAVTLSSDQSAQGNLNWSASGGINGTSFSPSSGVLSPGHQVQVAISVPGTSCPANATIAFSGPANTVNVSWNCSPPTLKVSPTGFNIPDSNCSYNSGDGWTCTDTLSLANQGDPDLTWSTAGGIGGSSVQYNPSSGTLSGGQQAQVKITIPDVVCPASLKLSFLISGGNSVDVSWNCNAPALTANGGGTCSPDSNGNGICTDTLALASGSQGDLNWSASSDLTGVTFNPPNGTLAPGQSVPVTVTVPASDCSSGSGHFYYAGNGGNTATVTWTCTTPTPTPTSSSSALITSPLQSLPFAPFLCSLILSRRSLTNKNPAGRIRPLAIKTVSP